MPTQMYEYNNMPEDEKDQHVPFNTCPCRPILKRMGDGMLILVHRSFNHREWWMAVEILLGFRCNEHKRYVAQGSLLNHVHVPEPELLFEYAHEKQ